MKSQEHRGDEMQYGEQVRSPVEQWQTSTPVSSWQGMNLLLRVLGIAVPLVGSFVVGIMITQMSASLMLVMGLLGVVGTILLRSLWAVAVVPAALVVGLTLGAVLPAILQRA